jgi:Tol biopolymer transport system component
MIPVGRRIASRSRFPAIAENKEYRVISQETSMNLVRLQAALVTLTVGTSALTTAAIGFAAGPVIYVINADGSDARRLVQLDGYYWLGSPQFSSDGRYVAFNAHPEHATTDTQAHIFRVPADGGEAQDLGVGRMPYWSRDDKQIAFFVPVGNPDGVAAGVWIMNSDGSGRQRMFDGEVPCYSPDGGRIAYASGGGLYVYDTLDGTSKQVATEGFTDITGPAWSPDGRQLAFVNSPSGQPSQLAIVDASGSGPPKVRWTGNLSVHLNWAPGTKILLGITKDRVRRPYSIDPNTNDEPEPLKNQDIGRINNDGSWSPDGRRITFISDRSE